MEDFLKVKHSFNAGDLCVVLPGLQYFFNKTGKKSIIYQRLDFPAFYYEGAYSPIRDKEGQQVCMNKEMFDRLLPLIKSQPYIEDFRIWDGEKVDINIDDTRNSRIIPMPAGLIHYYAFTQFPQLCGDLSYPWLHVENRSIKQSEYENIILINRTQRYTNPYISYHFLREYQERLLFIGTDGEHQVFCNQFNLEIKHKKVDNFLQLANLIQMCKGGLYNQSFCWHISDALKTRRILELSPHFPNTFPTGMGGYAFYEQKALEYHFYNLIKK